MFVHKRYETLEKIGLARGARLRMHVGCKPLRLVEGLQQDILQPVADDCVTENVATVPIGIGGHLEPVAYPLDDPVRKADDRMFVQDVEKGGIEAIGRLREKFERKSAETHTKIVRTFVQMEDRTRQEQQQRIARNAVAQLIDRHRRTAPAAEENRTALRTARVLLEITQIGVADHELLLGGGHYRIIFSHI